MICIEDGTINMEKLEVADIIDVKVLQDFLDNFAIGMNCAAVSVDRLGKEITNPSHYRMFCEDFIHSNAIGDNRCAECHNQMGKEAIRINRPYIGSCHAGLIDFAAPIIINGEHLGTVLGGQILDREPVEGTIRRVAEEIHLDSDKLWNAAHKIDIVQKKNIEAAADVLYIVVNNMAQTGYNKIESELLSKKLAENFLQISQSVDSLAGSSQDITLSQHTLGDKIKEIESLTEEITVILQSIKKVANQTKLIGINASIEAARLGNDGRGFSVVAKEIQNLSGVTKDTAIKITELNKQIDEKVSFARDNSQKTVETTEEQSAAMEELSAAVQDSVKYAEALKRLAYAE